ncbi:inhibitor of apoptosis-promoting Bax1-domain-containing protein [Mycena galopus ATCC 62051]|nr:inhibitor of apoptosis-promoting Bax1-domain-containing protein [Mycena galopus ATCC 62051]
MSQCPVPPPSYSTHHKSAPESTPLVESSRTGETEPLLTSRNNAGSVFDQLNADDLPDDFKLPADLQAFIRKVYSILLSQISKPVSEWVMTHLWAFFVPLVGTLVNLGLLLWKRHSHPWNFFLLVTLLEAYTIGFAVAFYENGVILQALAITLVVFIGLTLFTLQSKYDFDGMTLDIVYTVGGCLIFSGFIVYDMYRINRRLSPDEFISGSISLYLE